MSHDEKKPGLIHRAVSAVVGLALIAWVGEQYATTLPDGKLPLGHPWLELALVSFGASLIAGTSQNKVAVAVKWIGRASLAGSGGMWAFKTWWS